MICMKINDLFQNKKNNNITEAKNLGLTIFDIDDTLFRTTAQIKVVKDGKIIKSLNNQEFNTYKLQPGESFDFGEFQNAEKFNRESIPIGPMIAKLKVIINNAGDSKVIMLTARSDFDNKELFLDTFRKYGIDMNRVHVHRAGNLGGSPSQNKAVWIRKYLDTGDYARVRLYDDAMSNIKMFISLQQEYPDVKFFPYFVTHEGSIKTIREDGRIVNNVIDNKNGWGAVPNNQEVDYLGLRVMMSPKTFIDLAAPLDGEPSNEIFKHIQNGGKIGSPFLRIEIPESWTDGDLLMPARVVGHEGRNRMLAIEKVIGNAPIEVHLFFSQGLRNRHITDDMKKMLNKGLVKEKSKSIVRGPLFSLTESIREDGRIVKGVNTTVDVGPNEIKTQAAKFGNRVDKDGYPPTMSKAVRGSSTNVLFNLGLAEGSEPRYTAKEWAIMEGGHSLEDIKSQPKKPGRIFSALDEYELEDRHPNERPVGPEIKPTMPAGTVRVKVSDVYDWYKLGQHISDLEGLGKHDFGKGPPEAVISFGSEDQEHKYIALLKKLGLDIIDVDPGSHDNVKGIEKDTNYNVGENFVDVKKTDNKNYLLKLERDKRAGMLILHILDKDTGKRTEVRGKMGYETNGYDPEDKLHQLLDKVGKSASVSDLMNGDVVSINPRHPDGASAKAAADKAHNENFAGGKVKYAKPQFDVEWEEAERYPEFVKIGKAAWIELANKGKAVTIKSAKGINNTDADEPDSFKSLDKDKQKRAMSQIKSGNVEMPIVAVYPDGWKELIGGNTRLTAMLAQDGKATVWVFRVPAEILDENFADGKVKGKSRPGRVKRAGASCKGSVTDLRKRAKVGGERGKMYHWCANMKSGKK
jgi:hypothetical protein